MPSDRTPGPSAESEAAARWWWAPHMATALAIAVLAILLLTLSGPGDAADQPASVDPNPPLDASDAVTDCAVDPDTERPVMNRYIQSPEGFPVRTEVAGGRVSAVTTAVAPLELGPGGESPTLPSGPCQHIYRWAFQDIPAGPGGVRGPFEYMEIDWNTEGLPRGPNNTFVYPHFDFHFYTRDRDDIQSLTCVPQPPTARVCDPLASDYERMRAFLSMPAPDLVPSTYRFDIDSSIPQMGLHALNMGIDYTVDTVNRTPTLIYGSYDGEIVFLEASVTLFTLQDVQASPEHELTWTLDQPRRFAEPVDWPTEFRLRYVPETDRFEASFSGFQRRA